MIRSITLCVALGLSGCTAIHDQFACRDQVGQEPDAVISLFALGGVAIKASDPAWKDWQARMNDCLGQRGANYRM